MDGLFSQCRPPCRKWIRRTHHAPPNLSAGVVTRSRRSPAELGRRRLFSLFFPAAPQPDTTVPAVRADSHLHTYT
jgi:hypothetical protein